MSSRYQTILFDLDGTLTDSGPGIIRCAKAAMDEMGISYPDTFEALRVFVGPPLGQTFMRFGVPEERVGEAVGIYRKYYHDGNGKFENSPYEGIEDFLKRLCSEGYELYVATSKPEYLAIEILDYFQLSQYFRIIGGSTPDFNRENKDEVIRYLLERIGDTGRIIMVGDTVFDVKGAAELNIPCIGVSWGYGSTGEMLEAGAVGVADTFDELYEMIAGA